MIFTNTEENPTVSRSNKDHRSNLRRSNAEKMNHFLFFTSCCCSEPGWMIMHLGNFSGTESMQAPSWLPLSSQPQSERTSTLSHTAFSHMCHQCCICGSSSLPLTLTAPFLYLSHLSIEDLIVIVTLETAMYHIVYCFTETVLHTNIHCKEAFWFKVSVFWSTVNTGLLLRLSQVSWCCSKSL